MEIGLLVLQNPCTTEENEHLVFNSSKFGYISDEKYVSQLGIG